MTIGPWQYDIIDAYGETKHIYTRSHIHINETEK